MKRFAFGQCNICRKSCKLTYDHVPPKGSIKPQRVGVRSLAQTFDPVDPRIRHLSQNGVKFRSLCSYCNNTRLGREFDPALNEFSREIAKFIRPVNRLFLPPKIEIKLKPQRVARAVIGHLLAAEIREDMALPPRSAPMLDSMREYFLDTSLNLPTDLNLYFWAYRAKRQVILKGIGIASSEDIIVGDFLKYFPVAFWLTHRASQKIKEEMQDQEISIRDSKLDDVLSVAIKTDEKSTFRANWPEVPGDHQIVLVNDGMCFIADAV